MARTSLAVQEQLETLGQKVAASKIAVPFTQIVNRAQIDDFTNDLSVNFGLERIHCGFAYPIYNERGPNGDQVWKILGDTKDQIRIVNGTDGIGSPVYSSLGNTTGINQEGYLEVTFYGTAVNIVIEHNSTMDLRVSVDGGAEGANILPTMSAYLSARNYNANYTFEAISGLSLGLHTVKIRNNAAAAWRLSYIETVCVSTALQVRPGSVLKNGQKFNLAQAASTNLNSSFEVGSDNGRGGNVVVYAKADGTIAKAIQPVENSAAYLTSANHTNEEQVNSYHFRQFGANRADDFSTLTTSSSTRAFTLEDGVTTLIGENIFARQLGSTEHLSAASGHIILLTFVGTGLDIVRSINTTTTTFDVSIDGGASVGSLSLGSTQRGIVRIASGLPYGSHTVQFTGTSGASNEFCTHFIVYAPKKPTIPSNAVELSQYYLMANYSFSTGVGVRKMSSGVLSKSGMREITYTGGWAAPFISPSGENINGFQIYDTTLGNAFKYTFFGTGMEWRFRGATGRSSNVTLTINGLVATLANFPTLQTTTSDNATLSLNTATGAIDSESAAGNGQRIAIYGLPLGNYTFRFVNQTTSGFQVDTLDIITPIYSPKKINQPILGCKSDIGSCSMKDLRQEFSQTEKIYQAQALTSGPTTTSTLAIQVPEMFLAIESEGEWFEITYEHTASGSANNVQTEAFIFVNGVQQFDRGRFDPTSSTNTATITIVREIFLPTGTHSIQAMWRNNGTAGTITAVGTFRKLSAKKIAE